MKEQLRKEEMGFFRRHILLLSSCEFSVSFYFYNTLEA